MGRTLCDAQRLEHAVDEEHALVAAPEGLGFLVEGPVRERSDVPKDVGEVLVVEHGHCDGGRALVLLVECRGLDRGPRCSELKELHTVPAGTSCICLPSQYAPHHPLCKTCPACGSRVVRPVCLQPRLGKSTNKRNPHGDGVRTFASSPTNNHANPDDDHGDTQAPNIANFNAVSRTHRYPAPRRPRKATCLRAPRGAPRRGGPSSSPRTTRATPP